MTCIDPSRRRIIQSIGVASIGGILAGCSRTSRNESENHGMIETNSEYPISLAQWSLHRTIRSGELDPLDFARMTREEWDLGGVEYVNTFFKDKVSDESYLSDLKKRADDHGVKSLLIMIDNEGHMGAEDGQELKSTIENHRRWLEAAKRLGCHSIRVNAQSEGTPDEQRDRCLRGFNLLMPHAEELEINVTIENHGGLSSNGAWLASLVERVGHPRLGTLPDFGNFILDWDTRETYDRYQGMTELMPYALALSAKSNDFDDAGEEIHSDFSKMLSIARNADYDGWVGIEYEGEELSERDGITATKDLLLKNGCRTT